MLLPPTSPPRPKEPRPDLPQALLSHTLQSTFPVASPTQTHSPLGQAGRSPWLQGHFCHWEAEIEKWGVAVGGVPGLFRAGGRYHSVFQMVGRALVSKPASLPRPKVLTVFLLQEAGSTCSSSLSEDISDSDELLLESLPSSENESSPRPSAATFLFFTFLFAPSSLCSLEDKGANGAQAQTGHQLLTSQKRREALKSGGEGGESEPARAPRL